jgi:NAD(P)-dependent dehydrogenase (short-subunit alcohol dehydrogenase family)
MTPQPSKTRQERVAGAVGAVVDTALDRLVLPGFSSIGYAVRRRLPTWPADPPPDALAGREVVVTGASSGLGTETAAQLLALGAHVHLVVRDEAKGHETARALGGPTTVWRCDIADLDSVRQLTRDLLGSGARLHGVVHNAGALPPERAESPQGHELAMALHVLGPVLMTELLLPAMAGEQARVVFVTSGGMYTHSLPVDDPEYRQGTYAGATAYARSKRTQVELLPELGRRWSGGGAAVYATHPGWAATPGVSESLPGFERVTRPILRDVAAGADTTTWLLAVDPRPAGGGLWHDRRQRPTSVVPWTRPSEAERRRMWAWAAAATGLLS